MVVRRLDKLGSQPRGQHSRRLTDRPTEIGTVKEASGLKAAASRNVALRVAAASRSDGLRAAANHVRVADLRTEQSSPGRVRLNRQPHALSTVST